MTDMIEPIEETPQESEHPAQFAPVHPLAALTTIVLDNIFGWIEIVDPLALLLTSFMVGGIGFITTMFVQRYLAQDEWGPSVAKGLVMGVLAGVPFQVTGTVAGMVLLGWAGVNKWIKLPARARQQELPPGEIVDVESKNIE